MGKQEIPSRPPGHNNFMPRTSTPQKVSLKVEFRFQVYSCPGPGARSLQNNCNTNIHLNRFVVVLDRGDFNWLKQQLWVSRFSWCDMTLWFTGRKCYHSQVEMLSVWQRSTLTQICTNPSPESRTPHIYPAISPYMDKLHTYHLHTCGLAIIICNTRRLGPNFYLSLVVQND